MTRPKVLITHALFEPARKVLDEKFDTEYWTATGHAKNC
jgi:hypothetical protein